MNYYSAFIRIATDSAAKTASAPAVKGGKKTIPVLEYELLAGNPYSYTQEELQFEVHARHKEIPDTEMQGRRPELWTEFFSKPRACLRTSSLAKTYGWGIHFDGDGKIGLIAVESPEYRRLSESSDLQQVPAMRSKR